MAQRQKVAEPVRRQVLEEIVPHRAHILVLQLDFFQLTEGHMRRRKVLLWGFWAPILNKPIFEYECSQRPAESRTGDHLWWCKALNTAELSGDKYTEKKRSREHLLSFETAGSYPWMIYDLSHFSARWNELEEGSAQTEQVNRTSRDCRIIQPQLCLQAPFLTSLSSFGGCCFTRGFKTHICFSHLIINRIIWRYRPNVQSCTTVETLVSFPGSWQREPHPSLPPSSPGGNLIHLLSHCAHYEGVNHTSVPA